MIGVFIWHLLELYVDARKSVPKGIEEHRSSSLRLDNKGPLIEGKGNLASVAGDEFITSSIFSNPPGELKHIELVSRTLA